MTISCPECGNKMEVGRLPKGHKVRCSNRDCVYGKETLVFDPKFVKEKS